MLPIFARCQERDEVIRTYKEQGRRAEIQEELKQLQKNYKTQALDAPEDICWLYGTFMEDYLHDVEICQRFARRSRERMSEIIIDRTKVTGAEAFHTIHNYIDVDEMILRKGAIAARAGKKVQGIYSTSVNADTLDEAPMAYKSLDDIIDVIRGSVDIIDIMKPVYNFKASDSDVPWKKRGGTNECCQNRIMHSKAIKNSIAKICD